MTVPLLFTSFFIAALAGLLLRRRIFIEAATVTAGVTAFLSALILSVEVVQNGGALSLQYFSIDALSALVLCIITFVGLSTALYSIAYLRAETRKGIVTNGQARQYFILLNLFLTAMVLAVTAKSPVFAWIAIEATTLSTAFLISFYDKPSAMEAAWKYLILNSIGLLLAFFGTLLYFTVVSAGPGSGFVSWETLAHNAPLLNPLIAKVAFIFILIGYGTKIGFVPMHTWKPDAYSKAPAPLGALFSGALLPVAFVVLLKFKVITDIATGAAFTQHLLLVFGLLSVAVAAPIVVVAKNYKRLLTYSSIENAGLMALGFGFGGVGVYAALLHMLYHSLVKTALFFLAGNVLLKYHSARIQNVRGILSAAPATGILFLLSFFCIVGMPPFGLFFTKVYMLTAGMEVYPFVAVATLLLTVVLFAGFFKHVTAMVFGVPQAGSADTQRENIWLIVPPALLIAAAVVLSVYLPEFIQALLGAITVRY